MEPRLFRHITGQVADGQPAYLSGYKRRIVSGTPYPAIISSDEESPVLEGILYEGLTVSALAALDEFEGDHYRRVTVEVQTAQGLRTCETFVLKEMHKELLSEEDWVLERYVQGQLWHDLQE